MRRSLDINITVSKKIADLLSTGIDESKEQVQVVQYGILCTLNTLEKAIVLIVIFLYLNRLKDFVVVCACLIPLRIFIGGSHRNDSITCLVQSLVTFFGVVFLQELVIIPKVIRSLLVFTLLIMIWSVAPMQSEKRPSYSAVKRMKFKAMALTALCCILQLCCCLDVKISNIVGWSIAEILLENSIRIFLRKRGDMHGRST